MSKEVRLVPYEPHMGADFVPYEVIEAQIEAAALLAKQPEPAQDAEAPAPDQPK